MIRARILYTLVILLGCAGWLTALQPSQAREAGDMPITCTFRNPLLALGQDPSVAQRDGFYYLVQSNSTASGFSIYKSPTLTGLAEAQPVDIYTAPAVGNYSRNLWAPELLYLRGSWYIYYAADDGNNDHHRIYVLQADTDDPTGSWTFKGPLFTAPELDRWSIDLTVFEHNDRMFAVWSGAGGADDDVRFSYPQRLFIAEMSDPLTVIGERVPILTPDQPWEMSVAAIAEGPQSYIHNGQITIVYSADASWSRAYKLAATRLDGDDPLDPSAWTKIGVVFEGTISDDGAVYGVGHNSNPVQSPDGSEWWNVYHAKTNEADGWGDRNIRAQRFTWNDDNTPEFGVPIPVEISQQIPLGEPCGQTAAWSFDDIAELSDSTISGAPQTVAGVSGSGLAFDGTADSLEFSTPPINTTGSYTVSAWVKLDDVGGNYTIVSQEGGLFNAFSLHLSPETGTFALSVTNIMGEPEASAVATVPPEIGAWTHVAGVRDGLAQEIRLYINGELAASAPFNADWRAVRAFVLGASKERGQRTHFFHGAMDEVTVYNGALSPEIVLQLAALYGEGDS